MKTVITLIVSLLITASVLAENGPAEVSAARAAAQRHNTTIETADAALEQALARARAEHLRSVIAAKERMIADLRRAYRIALRSTTPENAGAIERQIKRLQAQIEALRTPQEQEVSLRGLDPRLVGVIVFQANPRVLGRAYQIDGDGKVTVLFDHRDGQAGIDVGSEYQGVIRGGRLMVELTNNTFNNCPNGRVKSFRVTDDGQIVFEHTQRDHFARRGFVDQDRFTVNYDTVHFDSVDDLPEAYRPRNNQEEEEPEENPVPEEDEEEPEDLEEGVTFFGIPID